MPTYRYKALGVRLSELQRLVEQGAVMGGHTDGLLVTVTISDAELKPSLDEAMREQGYEYDSETNVIPSESALVGSALAAAVAPVSLNGQRLENVADPSAEQDAMTRFIVDARGWKNPCRLTTGGNINLSSAPATIDGSSPAIGNRVLVRNQTLGEQNGIYVWNGAGNAMTRATDFDTSSKVVGGVCVRVNGGNNFADTVWFLNTSGTIVLGTTPLTFIRELGGRRQSVFAEIAADTTTTSASFVDLLTANITTFSSILIIQASISASNSSALGANMDFQVLVDGVAKRGFAIRTPALSNAQLGAGLFYKMTGLTPGAHVVKLQWRTSAGTGQVRPVATIAEHASLLVEESTV